MNDHAQRVRFNELVNTLRLIDEAQLVEYARQFPCFKDEILHGPDAGPATQEHREALDRAVFSEELCNAVIGAGRRVTDQVIARAASLSRSRIVSTTITGLLGASFLAAIGLDETLVARISGVGAAVMAILNAALDLYAKRYSSAEVQRAVDARQSILRLQIAHNALRAAIRSKASASNLASASETCNQGALELQKALDPLRVL